MGHLSPHTLKIAFQKFPVTVSLMKENESLSRERLVC